MCLIFIYLLQSEIKFQLDRHPTHFISISLSIMVHLFLPRFFVVPVCLCSIFSQSNRTIQICRLRVEYVQSSDSEKECPICWEEFHKNDVIKQFACFCAYHKTCIGTQFYCLKYLRMIDSYKMFFLFHLRYMDPEIELIRLCSS
jgi:hypothetical protein